MAETHYIGGWAPGQGCYALGEMIGRGGFATVWRAHPVDDSRKGFFGKLGGSRELAIKVIPVYSSQERSRALREGQIAENLRHKNIVETLEVIRANDVHARIEQRTPHHGQIRRAPEANTLATRVCRALLGEPESAWDREVSVSRQ